ncbi:HigA family addiction module antitoxin [Propylenella binzhouense]|uniref:Addiction module antidote protein, HigA family n=1 Tax=Propylenella binzhouense TaxID=2555902 RepID=A0A964T851_9HYPH|nr:addiction module antidote protein, HigA family [Propylenella binzhouense]
MTGPTRDPERPPTHPGAFFREIVLPALGLSKSEVARALGISRYTLYQLLEERTRVTPEMAVRLGKLCGDGPEAWLAMQTKRDLWEALRTVDTSGIPTLAA